MQNWSNSIATITLDESTPALAYCEQAPVQ